MMPVANSSEDARPALTAEPFDEGLGRLVRPQHWQNPRPRALYDLVVLGAGTAGLVSAVGAAGLGARVALIERDRLGGDCLNTGCVPSKAILRTARAVGEIHRASALGVRVGSVEPDFSAVMRRMRQRRAHLAPNDSAERITRLGIDLFFGHGMFRGPRDIAVDSARLRFRRAIIATGSRPVAPPIEGLADASYLTNETIFDLADQPRRLLILGAGPIGCELAQAFSRLGTEVVLFDQGPRVLPHDDADASTIVQRSLTNEGIRLALGVRITRVEQAAGGVALWFTRASAQGEDVARGDRLLVAAGRAPDVAGMDLERAGIQSGPRGIVVNDRLRTHNPRVYAAGDVCSRLQFTHAADATARIAIQNALFFGWRKASALTIPWCTYTDPQVAHVGMRPEAGSRCGKPVQTITIPLGEIDRSVLDDEIDGFVRVHHVAGRVVGCTIVSTEAGNLIGLASHVIRHKGTLGDLSGTIFPYPTQVEAFRKAGDAYRRTSLTPGVRRLFERYFELMRW